MSGRGERKKEKLGGFSAAFKAILSNFVARFPGVGEKIIYCRFKPKSSDGEKKVFKVVYNS